MNNKEIILILTRIESNIDVNSLTYKGYCVWPFIRNQIANHLTNKDREPVLKIIINKKTSTRIIKAINNFLRHVGNVLKNWRHQRITKKDVIFLARTSERNNLVNGKWYNRHCDSFSDLFGKKYSIQRLEFSDNGKKPGRQYMPAYSLDLYLFINQIKFELIKRFLPGKIENYHILEDYLKSIDVFPDFSEKSLRLRIALIFTQKKIFSRIIHKCKPKLFFLVCYYDDIPMASILACHDHGIPVVEFQHGAQNDNKHQLTHWTSIPKQGYELMPDFFWNWGEASANRINKWANDTVKHKAFVGGNLWASKWINENFQTDDCEKYNVSDIFPKEYKHILISLQVWPDHFPDYLIDIIRHSPPEWFWHIRQHPLHKVSQEDLGKYFLSLPNTHIEEHRSREMPLYLLLQHIDLHLTGFSTVAFEAALFKVPTIFFHVNAKDGFRELFDNKLFFFAENHEEMLKIIKEMPDKDLNSNHKSSYITVDRQDHIDCLEKMMAAEQQREKSAFLNTWKR